MSSVVLTGDTSGAGTITVPAVAGTFTATIGSATGTHYPFTAGTAVASTSGTSIDFTSIPSWVKRITVMFSGVSTNGTSSVQVQIGDSGGVETSSYISTVISVATSSAGTSFTAGFGIVPPAAANAYSGQAIISLQDSSTNTWTYTSAVTNGATTLNVGGGAKALSATLDRVRITTVNGTDTFDAGSINILYE